jgi:ribonuclease P protein component
MNNGERETFTKRERLCSAKLIEDIFESGNVFYTSLLRISWIICSSDIPSPAQVAISVPKKTFKHAVTRNLIKRRIREAYRKNKKILYDCLAAGNTRIAFVLFFRQSVVPEYYEVEKSVIEAVGILCNAITKVREKS